MKAKDLPPLPLTASQYGFSDTPAFSANQMRRYASKAINEYLTELKLSAEQSQDYWLGHDDAVRGVAMRWEQALTAPMPNPGVMNEPLESLYRRTEALRSWNGLTLEDKQAMLNDNYGGSRADIMDKTEAILKARNT